MGDGSSTGPQGVWGQGYPFFTVPIYVLATHNEGKIAEYRQLFGAQFDLRTARELGLDAPAEPADTYVGNAIVKAECAARATNWPSLADDTGIEVGALGGAPGVRTARWAAEHGGWDAAMRALVDAAGVGARARLVCALAWAVPGRVTTTACGMVEGSLQWPPRDDGPSVVSVFQPDVGPLQCGGVLQHRRLAFDDLKARAAGVSGG